MNATLEQIYARHDPKVLLEKIYVKAGAPIGNTNAAKNHIKQTETSEFKAWFGDSKVVNADGKPLVVYHGTSSDVKEFTQHGTNVSVGSSWRATWFSDKTSVSEFYGNQSARLADRNQGVYDSIKRESEMETPTGKVKIEVPTGFYRNVATMPAYLSMQNPLIVDAGIRNYNVTNAVDRAIKKGHDGIIVKNVGGDEHHEKGTFYGVFTPTQIKSAIGNSGKFDPKDPRITSSLATRIETLLARDNRPTYYDPAQPELHNAVRDRSQSIYQRAVDRSVDYAAAKATKLTADRKVEAKKRATAEEEIILLFLMLMEDAGEEAYQTSEDELSGVLGEDPEVVPPAVLKEFVEQRRAVLSGFPIEMSQRLTRIVTDGIERGQTDREIRSKIAKEASAIKKGQGSVVSLTESQCTYGASQCRLLQRAGFETCFWVTQGDEKVRESHRECEEAGEVTIGHEFPNGLRFPGDPQGSAAEVINCRCLLVGVRRKQP